MWPSPADQGYRLATHNWPTGRVHIHRGKGSKDRFLPLPESTLDLLRRYWATHRKPTLLFPAFGRDKKRAAKATTPRSPSTVQGCMQRAVDRLGF